MGIASGNATRNFKWRRERKKVRITIICKKPHSLFKKQKNPNAICNFGFLSPKKPQQTPSDREARASFENAKHVYRVNNLRKNIYLKGDTTETSWLNA